MSDWKAMAQQALGGRFSPNKGAHGPGSPQGQPGFHPNEYKSFVGDPGLETGATGQRRVYAKQRRPEVGASKVI
jgi:hypothetical protein